MADNRNWSGDRDRKDRERDPSESPDSSVGTGSRGSDLDRGGNRSGSMGSTRDSGMNRGGSGSMGRSSGNISGRSTGSPPGRTSDVERERPDRGDEPVE
jgi:hypothetical protein